MVRGLVLLANLANAVLVWHADWSQWSVVFEVEDLFFGFWLRLVVFAVH